MEYQSRSEEETFEFGRTIAGRLGRPRVVLLTGELGAGKTAFTRGFAVGLGISDSSLVHSPTFSLVNQYQVRDFTLYHLDLYRLEGSRDFFSIGLQEILMSDNYVVIEWADRLNWNVPDSVTVVITVDGPTEHRRILVNGM